MFPDSLLPPNYISLCAEMNAKLDGLMSKWTLYENPLIREQYMAKMKKKWEQNRSKRNVSLVVFSFQIQIQNHQTYFIYLISGQRPAVFSTVAKMHHRFFSYMRVSKFERAVKALSVHHLPYKLCRSRSHYSSCSQNLFILFILTRS